MKEDYYDMDISPCALPTFNALGEIEYLTCGSWACQHCGVVNAWNWARRVHYGIALWRPAPAYFWTLTLPGWVATPAKGYSLLPKRWDNFRKALHRSMGAWYYVAFVEEHPHRNFIPHIHLISLQKAPKRLKDMAYHAGFGYQDREIEISGSKAAWYVSKYTTKQGYKMPRGFRRVRACQAWPSLPDPIAEIALFPMRPNEKIANYCDRVSNLVGVDILTLRLRYTQAAMAQRAKRMEIQTEVRQHPLSTLDKACT